MTSTNELEKRLLTRCYDSNEEILNILQTRYSTEGEQKPTILFKHVKKPTKNNRKSILFTPTSKTDDKITQARKRSTRNELKQYINTTITNQRKLIKKIRGYQRRKQPFSAEPMLDQYSIPKFEDFIKMNDFWQSYIQDLLGLNEGTSLNTSVILSKLVNADFNGCLLTVLQSRNTEVVGARGIVVWDCQHSFIMVVPRGGDYKEWTTQVANTADVMRKLDPAALVGGLKIIPKQYTLFGFDVVLPKKQDTQEGDMEVDNGQADEEESIGFTLIGSRFEIRSVERSAKKFKNHAVDDLL
ncbi:Pop4 protein [Candida orthopsilosis Co 90-125]|uniref:Ribonuclease P protein subunit n=1 Tax=Candida orthopsilosis (strain 90-125) TaxID=1136231 RepID=H8X8H1_CANO9|nr:Pop4 protein [Candida orthopsilosis Co 90-125]CCG24446.1 Pop4 protein [Candida orthopsilosis Co 90-125]